MSKKITHVGQFKPGRFYSFDDGFGDRSIGIKSIYTGEWIFIYDDIEALTLDTLNRWRQLGDVSSLEEFLDGNGSHEVDLLDRNPRKVK